jgi:hypothetical protein
VVAIVLFNVLHIIKWYYFCIGNGKGDLRPWSKKIKIEDEE